MKNLALLLWLSLSLFIHCNLVAAEIPDAWKPFQFLLGDWVGSGSGKPGESSGEFSLKFDLDQKILVRRNRNQLAPNAKQAGAVHEDLMIIYPQAGNGPFRADYFDSEGHVIHYAITFGEHTAVFESDGPATAPRFKLSYEQKPDGLLGINFAVAAPGKPFQTYVSGTAKRK